MVAGGEGGIRRGDLTWAARMYYLRTSVFIVLPPTWAVAIILIIDERERPGRFWLKGNEVRLGFWIPLTPPP